MLRDAGHRLMPRRAAMCEERLVDGAELPRLAFVHVPKVAGTSITASLRAEYLNKTLPAMTTLDYPYFDDQQLLNFRFYKGHAYRRDYARLPPDTRRFTVLRDPVARAISYLRYCRALDLARVDDPLVREATYLARTQSALEFIYSDSPFVIEHIRMGQMRQFLSSATLARVAHRQFLTHELRTRAVQDFIGELETFDFVLTREALALSFPLMVAELGLPARCGVLPRDNASIELDEFDPVDVRRAVMDVNGAEFECYEYIRWREMAWLVEKLRPERASAARDQKESVPA